MKKLTILLLALGFAACAKTDGKPKAAAARPAVNAPAPAIALGEIVSGDLAPVKGWEDLKGKAVVLEFWATWCAPCRENIPHMSELAEKFKDRPVVFISLTREPRDTVAKFLEKTPMKGNVAVSATETFRAYAVKGIPHTVLVDKDGVLRGHSYPARVTPETIEALLAGKGPLPGVYEDKPKPAEGKAG